MAKISAYPDGGAIQASDQLIVARAGHNKSILGSNVGGSGGGELKNILINGGFDWFRYIATATTLTTIADKGFGADRWQQFAENASWQAQQADATGETGLTSKNYGNFKKITNTGKGIFVQKVEGFNSVPLRSKTVVFQIKMKASAAKTIRIGILELQTAGTIDTFPAAIASAFGANTVDPTWGANVALVGSAVSCSVLSTGWTSFSVSVIIPATSKNVVCAIWTDSQFAASDILSVAEAGLFVASTVQPWLPRPISQELSLCERYAPGFHSDGVSAWVGMGQAVANNQSRVSILFKIKPRVTPTGLVVSASSDFTVQQGATATACNSVAFNSASETIGRCNFDVAGTPLTVAGVCESYANSATGFFIFTGSEL